MRSVKFFFLFFIIIHSHLGLSASEIRRLLFDELNGRQYFSDPLPDLEDLVSAFAEQKSICFEQDSSTKEQFFFLCTIEASKSEFYRRIAQPSYQLAYSSSDGDRSLAWDDAVKFHYASEWYKSEEQLKKFFHDNYSQNPRIIGIWDAAQRIAGRFNGGLSHVDISLALNLILEGDKNELNNFSHLKSVGQTVGELSNRYAWLECRRNAPFIFEHVYSGLVEQSMRLSPESLELCPSLRSLQKQIYGRHYASHHIEKVFVFFKLSKEDSNVLLLEIVETILCFYNQVCIPLSERGSGVLNRIPEPKLHA